MRPLLFRLIVRAAPILAICCPMAAAGPFGVTLPIPGITSEQLPRVTQALGERFGRGILEVTIADGVLSFWAGCNGPKDLLHLADVKQTLAAIGLKLDCDGWTLKSQEVGLAIRADRPQSQDEIRQRIESVAGAGARVIGSLLDGDRWCVIVHLEHAVDHRTLTKHLSDGGITLVDLVWGHWKYGYGIVEPGADEDGDHAHSHDMGAIARD